jgi:TRAP-type C4-dicarboxylate transport system substrate-binding protein
MKKEGFFMKKEGFFMKKASGVVLVVLMSFALVCLAGTSGFAEEKTIKLRYSTFFPPSHENSKITEAWCKEIEKRTNGRVKVRHYAGATLTPPAQTYDSIAQGVVDAGNLVLGYTMGKFPLSEGLDLPLGYRSGIQATNLANAYFAKFKPKEFDDVKVMYFHAQPPGLVHNRTKPIMKLEDMKGMKMRTFGSNAEFMKLLGGAPVAMPMGDAYDAISKGVADGLMCAYEALEGWKLGEVVKYTTENFGTAYTAVFLVAMNKKKWESLPPDIQKIIEQINKEWIQKQGQVWNDITDSGKAYVQKRGIKIYTLTAEENARWAKTAQPLFDAYVKKMKEKNLPGAEVMKFAREYLKANPK